MTLGLPLLLLASSVAVATEGDPKAGHPAVLSVELLRAGGGRLDWSAQGDHIAFDQQGDDGRYDIWLLDLAGGGERCVTCDVYDLRKSHNLNPAWHPSGRYLVFQAQSLARRLGLGLVELASPDRGAHGDLYLIRTDGRDFWQLTRAPSAVLDPHFSHEGDQLVWSERVGAKGGRWGEWLLRVARFEGDGKVPRLGRVRTFQPGDQASLMIAHAFTPNDRGLVFSGNLELGQGESGADVYVFDLDRRELERLTHSRGSWDGSAQLSPNGRHIAWTTSSELFVQRASTALPPAMLREVWWMARDGSAKERLTFFNEPAAKEALGAAHVGDLAWSPTGNRLAVQVIYAHDPEVREAIYLVKLDAAGGRP